MTRFFHVFNNVSKKNNMANEKLEWAPLDFYFITFKLSVYNEDYYIIFKVSS